MWYPSIIILFIVLLGIMLRKLSPIHLPIWVIMLAGAVAVLVTRQISFAHAWHAIDWNIIGYLVGVFILGQALEESGQLAKIGALLLKVAHSPFLLILLIFISQGIASAFFMNDTMAIVMTPLLLAISRRNQLLPKILLLSLAYAITIGSVMSPIGNPQNLLIAVNGQLQQPFLAFFKGLSLPTFINLIVGTLFIYLCFYKQLQQHRLTTPTSEFEVNKFPALTSLTKLSLVIFLLLIILKIILTVLHSDFNIAFYMIALIAAAPIVLFSKQRFDVLKNTDWATIVFFLALFILMQSVWDSHFMQNVLSQTHINIHSTPSILAISAIMSQLISNVPLVALYLPMLMHAGHPTTHTLLTLAAGSTIAGNFLIIGAASNIIIIQKAEKLGYHGIGFLDFAKIGIPLGLINLFVYWLFLT